MLSFSLWASLAPAQVPPPVIPEGVGVNIHFLHGERDLDLIAAAGIKFVRMDFDWQKTEKSSGIYDWSEYDALTGELDQRGMRAIYILDYTHSAYEPKVASRHALEPHIPEMHTASPRHPESIAAFARWAAASARHFHNRHVVWEIYNEPNGDFWKPKPNAAEYAALALETARMIRKAEPSATIVGPALSGFEWPFMETFLKSGVLEYIDAVSVHPYRNHTRPPETAAADYGKLRAMIDQYAPKTERGKIPILSGEWGYSSNTEGVSASTQGAFAVRQQLSNLLNGVPLSIWYDWKNDGWDPGENEQNFGSVTIDLTPKPAYLALRRMTSELAGYRLDRRMDGFGEEDYVLLFKKRGFPPKVAAWTLAKGHSVVIARSNPELGAYPIYFDMPQ